MALIVFPKATATITHSAVDTTYLAQTQLRSIENGVDTASVLIEDRHAIAYQNVSRGDAIVIKIGDARDTTLTTRLNGVIYRVDPLVTPSGSFLKLECDGAGWGLDAMRCLQEYGAESKNSTLDTIKEILEDNTYGIIDKYVNKILGSATDSGFNYTTQIEDVVGSIGYVNFPYKPCSKSINDVCDIIQAIKGTNAGVHWRVDPSNHFLLAKVGDHGAPASTFWSTYFNGTQTNSTFTEGKDFESTTLQQLPLSANYLIYQGLFKKPGNGDLWTENNSALWGADDGEVFDDNNVGYFMVGDYSIRFEPTPTVAGDAYYPITEDGGWDFTDVESIDAVPTVNFYWRKNGHVIEANTAIRLCTTDFETDYFQAKFCEYADDDYKWAHASIPLGSYWHTQEEGRLYRWSESGNPDWSNINVITIHTTSPTDPKIWIDNLRFEGMVMRVASQNAGYSAADPCVMKLITDSVAKDDSLNASDDSGTMARLCYAEYLRSKSTPLVGKLEIGLHSDIVGGQLIHLHAKKKANGTFAIDQDFRVTRATHDVKTAKSGTTLDITSDILNSCARPVPDTVNKLYDAVKPEAQDRQAASYKLRGLNVTHPRLEKKY